MELNPIGATGGWCDGFKGRWKVVFFSRCFHVDTFLAPPKKQSFRWTVFNLFFRCSSCLKKLWIFCWQIWPPSKKTSPFFYRSRQPPNFCHFFHTFFHEVPQPWRRSCGSIRCSNSWSPGGLGGWGQVARGHCLQTWLAPSIARKPRKSQQNWGRKKRLGRTYDWQIWGLMDAFKWQKA